MAFAELGRGVAVELQSEGQGRAGVGPHGGAARGRCREFRDVPHARAVMVAARKQSLAGGRAKGGGVKAVVLQPMGGQPLKDGGVAGTTEGAGGTKAHVVQDNQQDVGRSCRGPQIANQGVAAVGIPGTQRGGAHDRPIGDGQHLAGKGVMTGHGGLQRTGRT